MTKAAGIVNTHAQHDLPGHAPAHGRQPARRADADDGAGNGVRGADAAHRVCVAMRIEMAAPDLGGKAAHRLQLAIFDPIV